MNRETLTLQVLKEQGCLTELVKVFGQDSDAWALLEDAGVPPGSLPRMGQTKADVYWRHVCTELHNGLISDGLLSLLQAAAKKYPGNEKFQRFLAAPERQLAVTVVFVGKKEHRYHMDGDPATMRVAAIAEVVVGDPDAEWPRARHQLPFLASVEVLKAGGLRLIRTRRAHADPFRASKKMLKEGGAERRLRMNTTLLEEKLADGAELWVTPDGLLHRLLKTSAAAHYGAAGAADAAGDAVRLRLLAREDIGDLSGKPLVRRVTEAARRAGLLADLIVLAAAQARGAVPRAALAVLAEYGEVAAFAPRAHGLLRPKQRKALADLLGQLRAPAPSH
jgi:hypothetical protein